jgi:hypothetical protein
MHEPLNFKHLLRLVLRTYTVQFIMEVRNEHVCILHMDILRGSAITNMETAGKVCFMQKKLTYKKFFLLKFFDKNKQR